MFAPALFCAAPVVVDLVVPEDAAEVLSVPAAPVGLSPVGATVRALAHGVPAVFGGMG